MRRRSTAPDDLQRAIAADIEAAMKSFVGKPATPEQRRKAQRAVSKVLMKYREVGLPVDVVRAFVDMSTGKPYIRIVQEETGVHDVLKPPAKVYSIDELRLRRELKS